MSVEATATRLAGKLLRLTSEGKIIWEDAGLLGPWGEGSGRVFKASVEEMFAQIAEVPLQNSQTVPPIISYYFGLAEGTKEIFEVFAEGYPAEPTSEKRVLWYALKELYVEARNHSRATEATIERIEHLLERLA
jgi:hypothetical protein